MNDLEVFKPEECYYAVKIEDGEINVFITDKKYWEAEQCLNDCFADHSLPENSLPDNIHNLMEATWASEFSSVRETKDAMDKAGFVFSKEMEDWLEDQE